jgi:hypothetical protein
LLEARIEETLGRLGIDAAVVSLGRNAWVGGRMVPGAWGGTAASQGDALSTGVVGESDSGRFGDDEGHSCGFSGGALPLSLRAGGSGVLSDDVLEVVRETVREFVAEHAVDFVRHFSARPDPKTLN